MQKFGIIFRYQPNQKQQVVCVCVRVWARVVGRTSTMEEDDEILERTCGETARNGWRHPPKRYIQFRQLVGKL